MVLTFTSYKACHWVNTDKAGLRAVRIKLQNDGQGIVNTLYCCLKKGECLAHWWHSVVSNIFLYKYMHQTGFKPPLEDDP